MRVAITKSEQSRLISFLSARVGIYVQSNAYHSYPAFELARTVRLLSDEGAIDVNPRFARFVRHIDDPADDFIQSTWDEMNQLTDTGLRMSGEAREYFEATLETSLRNNWGWTSKMDSSLDACVASLWRRTGLAGREDATFDFSVPIEELLKNDEFGELTKILWCYVSYFGSWEDGLSIATSTYPFIAAIPPTYYGAYYAMCCGNVFAVHRDKRCRELLELAFGLHDLPMEKFFCLFRRTVAEVKRIGTPETIATAFGDARNFVATIQIEADRLLCLGILENLNALVHLKARDYSGAQQSIENAVDYTQDLIDPGASVDPAIANRYRLQILQNYALMAGYQDDWTKASSRLQASVEYARTSHPDSLSEALSLLGYALIRSGNEAESIQPLREAAKHSAESRTPIQMRQIDRLLVYACHTTGLDTQAKLVAERNDLMPIRRV